MTEDNNEFSFAPSKVEPESPVSLSSKNRSAASAAEIFAFCQRCFAGGEILALSSPFPQLPMITSFPPPTTIPPSAMQKPKVLREVKPYTLSKNVKKEEEEVIRAPRIENIVATVNFGCKLELRKIALHAKNAEYNPKRFAAVIMRIRNPKTTALIFGSGKMVCTGARSEVDSEAAARKYARTLKRIGFDVKFREFKVQNIVASAGVNFPVNLDLLQNQHQKFCTYDPELFPGLIYRMVQPRIVLLIFTSGKVVLTGAKRQEELVEAFNKIYPVLCYYKGMPAMRIDS
eukprot:TRINITY_DN1290_c0_g2_i22.p1 TRINITY_DN1290_c0_g2~~TRINITY_DN1290_c0_g2_i22.p1  ORF type:complete len:332 (-),score=84.52 TRINITY_DN1290_c0_g2_i22:152-1015(-)